MRKQVASDAAPTPIPNDLTSKVWASPPPPQLNRHRDGDRIRLGATEITCVATPGHSPGEVCYQLPGHHYAAPTTSLMGEQRRANPFLHFDDAEAFCAFRAEHNRHRHPPYRPVPRGWSVW